MTQMEKGKKKTFIPPQERNIAMVFQEYALYPNMTVRENMGFSLKTKKVPKDEIDKLVMEQAEKLELTELLDRRIAQLSGGQRQRVALGRALVRSPQVFLLDEPLGNLDAKLRDQVRYELKKIQKELNVTTVYVTHDQTEAMTMADHIVLLSGGHIMQEGTPNDLYEHPANEFVAGFLGTPQINIFRCDVKEENGNLILDAGSFRLTAPGSVTESLKPYVGKKVDLGIRPSDFEMAQEGVNAIPAHVDSIEPLGDAYLIYVRVGEKVVVFKYAGETAPTEKELLLAPNMAKLHLFDPQTEKRINN
jgi:multiple sugar transport system ATP-binding protein